MKKYEVIAPFWHKGAYVTAGTEVRVGDQDAARLELGGYIKEQAAPAPVIVAVDLASGPDYTAETTIEDGVITAISITHAGGIESAPKRKRQRD